MQNKDNTNKSLAGASLSIFAAKFFPALALSVVWIIASKNINTEYYGLFQKFWTQLFVFAALGSIGIPVFILTYAPAKAIAIIQQFGRKILPYYLVFISALALLFGVLQAHQNWGAINLASSFLILTYIGLILADAMMIVFKNFREIITINLLFSIGFVLVHYIHIFPHFNQQMLVTKLCWLCAARLTSSIYFIRKSYVRHQQNRSIIDPEEANKIKSLWWQLGLNELITQMFRWVDKFVLSFILSQELFAIYFNGSTEFQFLAIMFSAVSSAAVQYWANHHKDILTNNKIPLLYYSARILSSIMLPLFAFFMLFSVEFLNTVFSEQYVKAASIFICTQLVLPLRSYPFTALLQSEHRGDIINKGAMIDFVLACLLMYPLFLLMGLPGVALSFVISTYWQAGYYLFASSQVTQIPIARLFPYKMLIQRLAFFGVIMLLGHTVATCFFDNITVRFYIGLGLLFIITISSLWQDWKCKD